MEACWAIKYMKRTERKSSKSLMLRKLVLLDGRSWYIDASIESSIGHITPLEKVKLDPQMLMYHAIKINNDPRN